MTEFHHIPVLEQEVIAQLAPRSGGVYCDGTLGGGGHTRRILEASSPDGKVIAIDRDPDALASARTSLAAFAGRLTLVHGRFSQADRILGEHLGEDAARVDGLVLDLGPSSPQFDRAERGFSFSRPGPLDMRMDPGEGETALELLRRLPANELGALIRDLGEERYGPRIAGRIKDALRAGDLTDTAALADLVTGAIPAAQRRRLKIHPATKTFQALRIAVNRELDELARFLEVFPDLLAPRGRCVIISFHSLEDRMVKRRFRALEQTSTLPRHLAEAAGERVDPICRAVTRRPLCPSDEEVHRNPRSRSAKLRACEKVAA